MDVKKYVTVPWLGDGGNLVPELELALRSTIGPVAEIGAFMGGSAQAMLGVMYELRDMRDVFIYDTCTGLPAPNEDDERVYDLREGRFAVSEADLRALFAKHLNVTLRVGEWPGTVRWEEARRYAFVHVDCDLYRYIKQAALFYAPRMMPGGIILFDDYVASLPGAIRAVDEAYEESGRALGFEMIKHRPYQASWRRKR